MAPLESRRWWSFFFLLVALVVRAQLPEEDCLATTLYAFIGDSVPLASMWHDYFAGKGLLIPRETWKQAAAMTTPFASRPATGNCASATTWSK